jgi:hypothetical protein
MVHLHTYKDLTNQYRFGLELTSRYVHANFSNLLSITLRMNVWVFIACNGARESVQRFVNFQELYSMTKIVRENGLHKNTQ